MRSQLTSSVQTLVGKKCWGVIAGAGTGSTIHLLFDDYVPRPKAIPNKCLTETERRYDGECDLFIECAWRLEDGPTVLCGSTDDDRNDGPMVAALSCLRDKVLRSAEFIDLTPDLILRFDEDVCLRIFCDQTSLESNYDNYSVRIGNIFMTVGSRGRIDRNER